MKQNQVSYEKRTTKSYKAAVEDSLNAPHATDEADDLHAEHTTDVDVHVIRDTHPEPIVATQPCIVTNTLSTSSCTQETIVSHPFKLCKEFQANHDQMHESSSIIEDFVDTPVSMSQSIITLTPDIESTADDNTEGSVISLPINDSKCFYTGDERDNDATAFNISTNQVPYVSAAETRYSGQQFSEMEQFPVATSNAAVSSSLPFIPVSYTTHHQHSLNQFLQPSPIAMVPPLSMVPMIPYCVPIISQDLPMPTVQPGQYHPMTYEGQCVNPYMHGYEAESTFQDTTMDGYNYETTEMKPHTDHELAYDCTTADYNIAAFQNEFTNEEYYRVTEMGYSDFEQTDDTVAEYDTSHSTGAAITNEEDYTITEMEFYRDVPLTTDSVVDTTIQSDHCPICDVNINEPGNEDHLVSQKHEIMEYHYNEYHKIKHKYESTVAEAETLITLTKGGSKTILQHQIYKIMESKKNFEIAKR